MIRENNKHKNPKDAKSNNVIIKLTWNLVIGDDCWIDNLDKVTIGSNVCISHGGNAAEGKS